MPFTVTAFASDFPLSETFETENDALVRAKFWDENGLTDVMISNAARVYTLLEFALRVMNN